MTTESDNRRRALAHNAVGPALKAAGHSLPLSVRQAVADAVLAAVDEPAERRAARFQGRMDAARAWARLNLDAEQQAGLLAVLRGDQAETAPDA